MAMSAIYAFVVALSLSSVMAETSLGAVREASSTRLRDKFSRLVKGHDKSGQGSSLDIVHRRQHSHHQNTASSYDRHYNLADRFTSNHEGLGHKSRNPHSRHWANQGQGHQRGYQYRSGNLGRVWTMVKNPGLDVKLRNTVRQWLRVRRASPPKHPSEVRLLDIRLPQGITYTWIRDVGTGRTFNEAAFKSKDKNVVVILSFDDALKDANLTASATLYDFTGVSGVTFIVTGNTISAPVSSYRSHKENLSTMHELRNTGEDPIVMAIKPRMRPGPCFLVETSLSYDKIIGDLNTRNGSSVSTSTVISLDGTGNPVSLAERQAMLNKTPSLSRQCRGREIIRTKRIGFPTIPYDGQTKELKVLAIDAQLSITVPAELDLEVGSVRHWFQNGHKDPGQVKGQGIWKGH